MDIVRKLFTVNRAEGTAPTLKGARFIASTATTDRYGDVVDQATWKLDNYRMNPVIQVDHSYEAEDTVGRGASVQVVDNALVVDIVWGTDVESQCIAQKVVEGLLSAVSVGFRPGRVTNRSEMPADHPYYADKEVNRWGVIYYDCELLEISVVAIPANPEALAQRSANPTTTPSIDISALVDQAVAKVLKALDERRTLAQPENDLESWLKGASK
jgi:hypothetical protein